MFPHTLSRQLSLRVAIPTEAPALLDLVSRNRTYFESWMPFAAKTRTVVDAQAIIKQYEVKSRNGAGLYTGIWDGERMIGVVLIREIQPDIRCAELGYFIDQAYEGKGIIREACEHYIHYLIRQCDMNKVIICCSADNERSKAIPLRLGFSLEGHLRQNFLVNGQLVDSLTYGLLASEYTG